MSYRRRHRWFRRMALGLAFAAITFAGGASVAYAKVDEGGKGDGVQVIPYLSHGILTEADRDIAAAEAIHDPYLTDVFARPGEASTGPDGMSVEEWAQSVVAGADSLHDPLTAEEQWTVVPYLSQGILTDADRDAAAAEAIHDRPVMSSESTRPSGDEIAISNAIADRALREQSVSGPYSLSREQLGEAVKSAQTQRQFVPGVTDFPKVKVDVPAVRPDDQRNRFSHLDVAQQPELSSGGSRLEWNDGFALGIGAIVLAIGLGLALGYLRRPRLAGL